MKNILVIEDNETDTILMKFLLNKLGYVGHFFKEPVSALMKLDHFHFQLIILDWQLPHFSGIEFLRRIKKSEDKKDIPVLMTSSRNDIKDVKLALKEGVFDYMIKPVDPQIFKSKLDKIFAEDDKWAATEIPMSYENRGGMLAVHLDLQSISEVEVTFSSNHLLTVGDNYFVQFKALTDLGVEQMPVRITQLDKTQSGLILYKASFIGLREGDLKQIRIFCKTLAQHQMSVQTEAGRSALSKSVVKAAG